MSKGSGEMKIGKDYRQTNDRQHAQKSPLDLSAQVSQKIFQGNDSYHVIGILHISEVC